MTTVFLIIGGIGVAVLAASLIFGELFELVDIEADGPFSVAALSTFAGVFGFAAAATTAVLPDLGSLTLLIAVLVGIVAAVPAAWLAARLIRAAMNMRTDPTLNRDHLIGATGVVLTRIPENGFGEVQLRVAGQLMKFNARANRPLPEGTEVFVISAPSDTSVVVEPSDAMLPDT